MEEFVIAITSASIGFVLYYFIVESKYLKEKLIRKEPEWSNIAYVVFQRLTGLFFFAIVPICLLFVIGKTNFHDTGSGIISWPYRFWLLVISLLILTIGF